MNLLKLLSIKSIAAVVATTILCFVSVGLNAETVVNNRDAKNISGVQKRVLTDDEKQYIYGLVKEIEDVFDFFRERIELFIDLRDKTPYRTFVGDLCTRIDKFNNETLKPLEMRIQNETNKEEPFYRGLVVVDELLVDFLGKLHAMRLVLVKYVSVKDNPQQAFALANELEPHLKALIAADVWNKLETKLTQAETLMNQVEDNEIMTKLAALKILLKNTRGSSSTVKISPTTVLACIRKKLRYN